MRADTSVYVVVDDPSFRTSVRRLLRAYGYDTALFESAGVVLQHRDFERALCMDPDVDLAASPESISVVSLWPWACDAHHRRHRQ